MKFEKLAYLYNCDIVVIFNGVDSILIGEYFKQCFYITCKLPHKDKWKGCGPGRKRSGLHIFGALASSLTLTLVVLFFYRRRRKSRKRRQEGTEVEVG